MAHWRTDVIEISLTTFLTICVARYQICAQWDVYHIVFTVFKGECLSDDLVADEILLMGTGPGPFPTNATMLRLLLLLWAIQWNQNLFDNISDSLWPIRIVVHHISFPFINPLLRRICLGTAAVATWSRTLDRAQYNSMPQHTALIDKVEMCNTFLQANHQWWILWPFSTVIGYESEVWVLKRMKFCIPRMILNCISSLTTCLLLGDSQNKLKHDKMKIKYLKLFNICSATVLLNIYLTTLLYNSALF